MKYAIYDKAADGYLTKMVFEVGYSEHTQFECGLNEYITKAELLDTKEAANLAITCIEGFKFMEKGRFVVHQFDDTLADQYIISEAGNPTKVVDNIAVDLDGTINVKYGTMACHWSTPYLMRAITRLNALQNTASDVYTPWDNTFDVYKVITVIDERECTHYQFINVTEKGRDSAKEEENHLNKRIEELEKANYDLGEQVTARGAVANRLQEEKEELEAKVESIKKEARHWKTMYESASTDNTFPCIAVEARELLKDINDIARAKKLANDIINIWEADDKFEITLKKFSQLHEAVNDPSDDDDDAIMYAFKGVLEIFSSLEDHVRDIIDESVDWKRRAEEAIRDYTKCNEALGEWKRKCKAKDAEYEMLANKLESCEIILESTNASLKTMTKERDDALEQKEFYKRQANSVYGMSIPCRCNGKQMFYDVTTGKKILVDKEKYDDLMECINNISLIYEMTKLTPFSMDRPSWLSGIINRINNLTI